MQPTEMSDDTPTNAPDHSVAKKRLARELRILVISQAIALCVAAFGGGIVMFDLDGAIIDGLGSALGLTGLGVSCIMAFVGHQKLSVATFLPVLVNIYALGGYLLVLFLLLTASPWGNNINPHFFNFAIPLLVVFLLYGIIPQYFIVHWLAKET
jgi:hypothetical protein